MRALLYGVMAVMLVSCTAPAPYDQRIEGVMVREGVPATNIKVRFLIDNPVGSCNTPGLDSVTDQMGTFSMSQRYDPVVTESYAVVVHTYRLCVFDGEQWRSVWEIMTGPAPKGFTFRCDVNNKGEVSCNAQLR